MLEYNQINAETAAKVRGMSDKELNLYLCAVYTKGYTDALDNMEQLRFTLFPRSIGPRETR